MKSQTPPLRKSSQARPRCRRGLTLIELLLAVAVLAMVSVSATGFLSTMINAQTLNQERARLYNEGAMLMQRLSREVQQCTYLLIPNNHMQTRDLLAFSGRINEDNDYYFDDPLFPRIDEDPPADMDGDGFPGIGGIDDNGDGLVDITTAANDDEDLSNDEEMFDGLDNDGDGNIDEDVWTDLNDDGWPGIYGMDDDGDGTVDEWIGGAVNRDDDEDGLAEEDPTNPRVYLHNTADQTLRLYIPANSMANSIVANQVTQFQTHYWAPGMIHIRLEFTTTDDETIVFHEFVAVRNVLQKTGKRVR